MMRSSIFCLLLTASLFKLTAQDQQLTLDRIFKSGDFNNETFGPAKWTGGGKAYTTLESSSQFPGKKDIVEYEAKSG
jgi:hypothetical protein